MPAKLGCSTDYNFHYATAVMHQYNHHFAAACLVKALLIHAFRRTGKAVQKSSSSLPDVFILEKVEGWVNSTTWYTWYTWYSSTICQRKICVATYSACSISFINDTNFTEINPSCWWQEIFKSAQINHLYSNMMGWYWYKWERRGKGAQPTNQLLIMVKFSTLQDGA